MRLQIIKTLVVFIKILGNFLELIARNLRRLIELFKEMIIIT